MIRRATPAPTHLLALLARLTASPLGGAAAHASTPVESALGARERLVLVGVPVSPRVNGDVRVVLHLLS